MGKQQFPKVLIDGLSLRVYKFDRNVFRASPCIFCAVVPLLDQRDKRSGRLYDRMPDRLRHGIAAAGRACRGIGQAAGCENDAVCGHRASAVLRRSRGHRKRRSPPCAAGYAHGMRAGTVRAHPERTATGQNRKNAVAALGLERAAVVFKEFLCVCGRAREGAVEKARVRRDALQHILPRAVVRDVAAALPVMRSLLPSRPFCSSSVTCAPPARPYRRPSCPPRRRRQRQFYSTRSKASYSSQIRSRSS